MSAEASPFSRLTESDVTVIRQCLVAATEGPFFPDWEFATLIGGMTRSEVGIVLASWPDRTSPRAQDVAVNDVLNNLISYPHGMREAWRSFISVDADEVASVLARWRGDDDFDPTPRATSSECDSGEARPRPGLSCR